jgi:hypothetical protein
MEYTRVSRGNDGVYRLSNSEQKTWKRCQRKWWLSYHRRLQAGSKSFTGALAIGTRVHLGLAAYYNGKFDRDYAMATYEAAGVIDKAKTIDSNDSKIDSEIDLGRIMLEGYFDWVEETGADVGLKLIAPETIIEAPSGVDGVNLRGRIDARFERLADGRRVVMDHKTAAQLSAIENTVHMDEQFRMYHLLERMEAWARDTSQEKMTDGVIVNVLRKVKRTERANPPFYERYEVRHNDTDLRNFYVRMHGVIRQILEAESRLNAGEDHHYVVPPNPTNTCSWDCPFYSVCPMFDDGSRAEDFLSEFYTVGDPDERYTELEQKNAAS